MKDINLELKDWELNSIYDKIINCRAVKPTYRTESVSWDNFMLDKRLWLVPNINVPWVTFKDYIDIDWIRYYYWETETEWKIYDISWTELYNKPLREWNPIKITKWSWGWWQLILDATETVNDLQPIATVYKPQAYNSNAKYSIWDWVTLSSVTYICIKECEWVSPPNSTYWNVSEAVIDVVELQPYYEWWLIALNVPWHWWQQWASRYITFVSWALKWLTKRIYQANWDKVYIYGTDAYGSLPETTDKYYVFSDSKDTIVLWNDDWVTVIALTGKENWTNYYYNLVFTYWTINLFTLEIDWTKILLNWENDSENRTILENTLWAWYNVTISNWLLYLYKDDGSEIIINQLDSILRVDVHFLKSGIWVLPYPTLWLEFEWVKHLYDTWTPYSSSYYLHQRYWPNWYQNEDWFLKLDFYKYIRDNLPAWYSYKLITTWSPTTWILDNQWVSKKEYYLWSELYIWKDDLQENVINRYNTYSTRVYINTNWDTPSTTIIINMDWVDHSISIETQSEWDIARDITDYFNAHADYRAIKIYQDWEQAYYIDITHKDWRQLNPTSTYSKITLSEYNYNTEQGYYYWVWLTWAIPADAYTYQPTYTVKNVNENIIYPYEVLVWEVIDGKQELNIIDIVEFEWALFVLTDKFIYFSRIDFDSNTQFYVLDNLTYRGWQKLIQFWHSLLVIWEQNKIIKKTLMKRNGQDMTSYSMKDLEYNWDLFSKYSYLYTDWVLYLLQDDKRLMTLQVVEWDSVESRIATNELSKNFRYLFELAQWECYMNQYENYINILIINWEYTTNYQFDTSRQIWIQNEYSVPLYKLTDEVLTKDHIALQSGFTDLWVEYTQEIHFSIWNLIKYTKVDILRTIFGLTKSERLDVVLTAEREENQEVLTTTYNLKDYDFDTDIETDPYTWNIASIQTDIYRSGKYLRFKYESSNRFIIWNSYLLHKESKPYVNNILTSN